MCWCNDNWTQNIFIGDNCACAAVTGNVNTIIGDNAGYDLTTGGNTGLGAGSLLILQLVDITLLWVMRF